RLDLLSEASAAIHSHVQLKPNDSEGHLLACRIERLRGRFAEAEKHLKEFKRINGSNERSQLERLLLSAMGGELEPADEYRLRNSLGKTNPNNVPILEALVFAYLREFRFGMSLKYLEKWLEEEPDSVRALSWRGMVKDNLNLSDEASDDYRRV